MFVDDLNAWIKAAHIVAVISWMAGMLYLPRLFVYHADAETGSDKSETFKVMEQKLLKIIINPAMIATWALGLFLAYRQNMLLDNWFIAKFMLVFLLSGYHGTMVRWFKEFQADKNTRSARFYRLVNEIPAVFMILIVILVVIKPF